MRSNATTAKPKLNDEIEAIRRAGKVVAALLDWITPMVAPGVTTRTLDHELHQRMTKHYRVIPAPLNYRGFPKSICTSVNHQVCHGIPGDRVLKNGDIVNIDVTVIKAGWHADSSRMYEVGDVGVAARRICAVALECLNAGIDSTCAGATLGDLGAAIQQAAESRDCSIVRDYCGHGIGRHFHEEPQVMHFGTAGEGMRLTEGMTFTIEPMVNLGKPYTKTLRDGWTVVTRDRSLSAQWEHTIAVGRDGCDILTLS